MRSRNRGEKGIQQAILAFLSVYAFITLAPACVFGLAGSREKQKELPAPASAGETVSQAESESPSESPAESSVPGFLEGVPTVEAKTETGEDLFTLYDQAAGETLQVPGRELLPAAVACEMDLSAPEEALKAQAVACYTLFSRKRAAKEEIVCNSSEWQVWTTKDHMQERWGEDWESNLAILESAVDQVYGQTLEWEGEPILAAYFAISAGSTETAGNVWESDLPYLQAVASPGDALSDGYLSRVTLTEEAFQEAASAYFTEDPPDFSGKPETWLTDVVYSPSGYVSSAVLGGKAVEGTELRAAFSLRSACFRVEHQEDGFRFTVRGWGHGVGMSQAGAVFLAKRGSDYQEILARYYPGAQLISP